MRRSSARRGVSSVVCLTAPLDGQKARLLACHFCGNIRARGLLVSLRYFHRQLVRSMVVILDPPIVHRARATHAFVERHHHWLRLEWLPGYAPEVNPEELCNGRAKRETLNALPASNAELRDNARRAFRSLGQKLEVLRGFFAHAGLRVNRIVQGSLRFHAPLRAQGPPGAVDESPRPGS